MDTFVVGRPLVWSIGLFALIVVIGWIAWGMIAQQFDGARRQTARVVMLAGIAGGLFVGIARLRPPVRVNGETLSVTWFPFETWDYAVSDVRFFDSQNLESGLGVRSDLEEFLLIVFRDGAYIDVDMELDNAQKLRTYLLRHGAHEGLPAGQTFQRAY